MKALVKLKAEAGIWLEEVPQPDPQAFEVLIKIKKTAICGTDLHIYEWDEWAQKNIRLPQIIGHEFVGEIVTVGKEVTNFKPGMRVSGEGHIACGYCRPCRSGRAHLCHRNETIGVTRSGCFADYLILPASNAYPIPDNLPDRIATILDPLGNATHAALSYDLVAEDILITGGGPVGLMAAAIARHVGARFIVLSDVNEYRLALAKKMGVTLAVNPAEKTFIEVMQELGMKEGFDVGLEMSGNSQAFQALLASMNHGGKIAQLGFLPANTSIDWNTVIMKGLEIKGIYGRRIFETWYKMIVMLQSGLNIETVITHEFPYTQYQQAFDILKSGKSGKVILNW